MTTTPARSRSMFGYPEPAATDPPSPIEPPRQNDFRDIGVTPEAERATWHERRSASTQGAQLDATREANPDEWSPITIPLGTLTTDPVQILGDDPERRSAVLLNIGTEAVLLGPNRDSLNAGNVVATCFYLPAGASLAITTTRKVFVAATVGTAAGISALVERGARTR